MHTLIFDIETHDADYIYSYQPWDFLRLAGYKWVGESGVRFTSDIDELRELIDSADMVIGHNIHSFDLPAVYGTDSLTPMHMADEGRVYDTWTHAVLANPAPMRYTNRDGRIVGSHISGVNPGQIAKWNSLDEQAYQLGVRGKTDSLSEIAFEYGNPSYKRAARIRDGYGKIPITNEDYRHYLAGDVLASEAVARALLELMPLNAYAMREQRIEARKQVISNNGLRVDVALAESRAAELEGRRRELIDRLALEYGFPTGGKKPWVTTDGKAAIMAVLADNGITPQTVEWPMTASRHPSPSLGAEVIKTITANTKAENLGIALAELQGQRVLSQLALDSMQSDGFVHSRITMLQRSGRWSTTNPGLTVWSEHDPIKRLEKSVFIPDSDDQSLMEFDYSSADGRIIAALSGDTQYLKLFSEDNGLQYLADITGDPEYAYRFGTEDDGKPKAGMHGINAVLAFGASIVRTNPKEFRQTSKALGHAWNYGAGPKRLSITSGLPLEVAEKFDRKLKKAYPKLTRWQDRTRAFAKRNGYVINPWGRIMRVDRGHEYTQAPALMGQSGTREVICDALLALPDELMTTVKAQVHDALLVSVPTKASDDYAARMLNSMQMTVSPDGGQSVEFPVSHGNPASDWAAAGH
jgi:DNA polymerase-1